MASSESSENTIHTVRFDGHFTTTYNATASDPRLSWEAKGLLWYLLSRPKGWQTRVSHLKTVYKGTRKTGCGRDALRRMIKELIDCGYILAFRYQNDIGRWCVRHDVYPIPYDQFQKMFPETGSPALESPAQENTALYKRKEEVKKDLKKKDSYCEPSAQTKPTSDTLPAGGNKNVSFSSSEKEKSLDPSLPTKKSKKTTTPELYKCLAQCVDLSDLQKSRFLAFPEPLVESIVRYCYHHTTQVEGGPVGRLKLMQHMAKNFEDYAESVAALDKPKQATTPEPKTSKREQLLGAFKHGEVYNGYEFFRDSIGAGFIHPTMTMSESCSAKWTDPKFNEKFKKILEKLKIII